jgi:hypothetical protein
MRYGIIQPSVAYFSSRFKVLAAAFITNTGIANLEFLLDQLVYAVRTAVDIFVLAVNTLLLYVSHLILIE